MHIEHKGALAPHSTMRLGGTAEYIITVTSEEEVVEAVEFSAKQNLPFRMIGKGSNVVWPGDFAGIVLVNAIKGVTITNTLVTAASGELWDELVANTVEHRLSGLECLSLIPGTVGAVPVQNVGAYGAEVQDTITMVRAFDTQLHDFVELSNRDCKFGYRSSRFNTEDAGRFLITQVTFALSFSVPTPPFYTALEEYFLEHATESYNVAAVREAVIAIRRSKLPDPNTVPNCGSFFKNPIISKEKFAEILKKYPEVPHWLQGEQVKISAAWLLQTLGFKDYYDEQTGMATYEKHALIVVNESAKSAEDLVCFTNKLTAAVKQEFGIILEQEPELLCL